MPMPDSFSYTVLELTPQQRAQLKARAPSRCLGCFQPAVRVVTQAIIDRWPVIKSSDEFRANGEPIEVSPTVFAISFGICSTCDPDGPGIAVLQRALARGDWEAIAELEREHVERQRRPRASRDPADPVYVPGWAKVEKVEG
jgi:hypothetical protein